MNVLPSTSNGDMLKLVDLVEEFGRMDSQLTVSRAHASDTIWTDDASRQKTEKIVLSTFSGGEASYGGVGWEGFLRECKRRDLDVRTTSRFTRMRQLSPMFSPIADILHTLVFPSAAENTRYAMCGCHFRLERGVVSPFLVSRFTSLMMLRSSYRPPGNDTISTASDEVFIRDVSYS
jgi:hypothetical protein